MFKRVLIANRGEIAVRVIHACRELGAQAAAVYSEADADAPHVRLADVAAHIGPAEAAQSYLDFDKVLGAARAMDCDALHPGYGFLAENAGFAQAVLDAGLAWIGPPPDAMRRMGLKIEARQVARAAGAQLVPGFESEAVGEGLAPSRSVESSSAGDTTTAGGHEARPYVQFAAAADALGYPVLVKASAGGGGKGMRLVASATELPDALSAARREAQSAFGNDAVYLEKYIARPRHIEVQLLGDAHGNVIALGERECSIQRRHQKLIEETPSVAVTPEMRERLCATAVKIAKEVGYVGAGTIEFILAADGEFYFLEMNTRLQVEHPVTELVYGLDIVQWQIRIAAGENLVGTGLVLSVDQPQADPVGTRFTLSAAKRTTQALSLQADADASATDSINAVPTGEGHSIEARIVAEDPARGFLPQTGRIELLRIPNAPGVRFDHALRAGLEISPYYDSLLGKLIVWHETRAGAIERLLFALRELRILGVPTNITFLQDVLAHPAYQAGELHTGFIEEHMAGWQPPEADDVVQEVAQTLLSASQLKGTRQTGVSAPPSAWESLQNWSNT